MEASRLGRINESLSFLLGYRIKVQWNKVLPKLMAVVTRHPRYLPEIEWASDNWTHNAICLLESIFGARMGIRGPQTTSWTEVKDGIVVSRGKIAHSFAGACIVLESSVRAYLKSWKFVPFRIYVPVMQTVGGFPVPTSPWLFAIAVDTTTQDYGGSAGTVVDVAHTAGGSNRFAWAGFFYQKATATTVTAMTYDGTAMVATANTPQTIPANGNNSQEVHLYGLASPSTTTDAVVSVTFAAAYLGAYLAVVTYTGCQSSSTADASTSNSGNPTVNNTLTLTTVADNCWVVGFWRCEIGGGAAGTNTTIRYNNTDGGMGDTNAAQTPAGSKSIQYTFASAINAGIAASFGPTIVTMTVSVSDQLDITDVVTIVNIKNISVSDQLNITETVTMLETSFINISDQLNITESVTVQTGPFSINISDQLTVSESITIVLFQETLLLSVSDQLTVSESIQADVNSFISVSDQITISESVSITLSNNISVSDQLNVTESVTVGSILNISVSDQLNITESVTKEISEVTRGLIYMRGNDQNLPVTLTKQDYPLGFNDTSVS